jgi:DNA polymerase III subunit delta
MAKEAKSTLRFSEAINQIEKGRIASAYFLNGEEDYLQIEFINTLKQALYGDNKRDASIERISARAGKAADLSNTILEYSLFGGGKLVLVHDSNKYNNDDRELLLKIFGQIPTENHLVLFHRGKMDMRRKYFKYVTAKTEWISLLPLNQSSAKYWIKRQLKKYDLSIDMPAIELMIEFAGLSYSTISEEVDKLSLNIDSGKSIAIEDIKNYGSKSAVFSIFELTDALGRKNKEKAINRLSRLLESGESLPAILAPVARHFNYLVMINSLSDLKSNNMVAARVGVQPFFVQKCREQISCFSSDTLKKALRYIFEAEYQSRYESISPGYILENLVIKITNLQE